MDESEIGLCSWDSKVAKFVPEKVLWKQGYGAKPLVLRGLPVRWNDPAGKSWMLYGDPFPKVRCPDDFRQQIMPVNKKWPVAELFEALDYWNSKKNQKLTLEYILIQDVNDSLEQAAILARHARRLGAKVNLIPYNTVEGLEWKRPPNNHCRAFQEILKNAGVTANLRLEKGHDIDAACGQLRLKQETAEGIIEAPMKR